MISFQSKQISLGWEPEGRRELLRGRQMHYCFLCFHGICCRITLALWQFTIRLPLFTVNFVLVGKRTAGVWEWTYIYWGGGLLSTYMYTQSLFFVFSSHNCSCSNCSRLFCNEILTVLSYHTCKPTFFSPSFSAPPLAFLILIIFCSRNFSVTLRGWLGNSFQRKKKSISVTFGVCLVLTFGST